MVNRSLLRSFCLLVFLQLFQMAFAAASNHYTTIFPETNPLFSFGDTSYVIKRVVIDAGHGGKDSGCLGVSGKQEKDITLKIALAIGEMIKSKFPHIRVIYTRDEDVFIPLDERANIANRNKADLFISIHCNFVPNHSDFHGSETYVLGLERTKANLAVAKRENQSILMEDNYVSKYGDGWDAPEANILLTAWQSSYLTRSMHLAEEIENELENTANRRSHGVKQAGFLVLRQTSMPSILVETGFLSNPREEAFLSSREGQETEARAIFKAFCTYKYEVEGRRKIYAGKENRSRKSSEASEAKVVEVSNPVKREEKSKQQIAFKVQIASSPDKLDTGSDEKWNLTREIEIRRENKLYKYLVVGFNSYESALEMARKLSKSGFAGAFVCAYEGENRIDVRTAKEKIKNDQ